VTFKYDPFGRRIQKVAQAGRSIICTMAPNIIEEVEHRGTAIRQVHARGLTIDEPLAMLRSSTTSYYEADGLGSITFAEQFFGGAGEYVHV